VLIKDQDKKKASSAPSSADAIFSTVRTLVSSLGQEEKEALLKELSRAINPIAAPRAGGVLSAIIRLVPKEHEWTMAFLKKEVEGAGLDATDKEIYNAIGYLTRKKHIRRVGYGRYIVDGVPFTTADDLGGVPGLTEGDLDD
jgi:hypothetical protein